MQGRPSLFRCYACNRKHGGMRSIPVHRRVWRTGRTKPTAPSKLGLGAMKTSYEYECTCGHKGWTSHKGILGGEFDKPAWASERTRLRKIGRRDYLPSCPRGDWLIRCEYLCPKEPGRPAQCQRPAEPA